MTAETALTLDKSPERFSNLASMASKAADVAVQYVVAKTRGAKERVYQNLRSGDRAKAEYFVFAWVRAVSPLVARLCREIKATYLIYADEEGDQYIRDVVVLAERSNPAIKLLCESLATEFDAIKERLGLPFSLAVHAVDRSDVTAGRAAAAAIGSVGRPALPVWKSD